MIKILRIFVFILILSFLPKEVHAAKWNPLKIFRHSTSCPAARKQADDFLSAGRFDEASQVLEKYVATKECNATLQDRIDLIFSHYKAAGLDGGALSRAFFASVDGNKELFSAWKAEQPSVAYSESGMKHLGRAIQLHESLTFYYDHDAYFFKIMAMRTYRALVVALAAPSNVFSDELSTQVLLDLIKSSQAMAKTTKYRPEMATVLQGTANLLDSNHDGRGTAHELEEFAGRYR